MPPPWICLWRPAIGTVRSGRAEFVGSDTPPLLGPYVTVSSIFNWGLMEDKTSSALGTYTWVPHKKVRRAVAACTTRTEDTYSEECEVIYIDIIFLLITEVILG